MNPTTLRVLIAEDDAGLARAISFCLRQAGFEVTACHDGISAWEALCRGSFDVVVTDHQMPRLTGIELCRQMRASEQYALTPVVLITGRALELETRRLTAELNLMAVLPKPYSPRHVVTLIRQHLAPACTSAS